MPLLQIHRNPDPPRLIRMGQGPVVIEPQARKPETETYEVTSVVPDAPPEPVKNQRGRPKKMAEETKLGQETGVKKIYEEDPGKQGPVGTGGEKPANPPSEDITIGNKEGDKNG